ncbi:MAG: DMT family transporter [Terriglobia bacterium]|jgi:transporter family protein
MHIAPWFWFALVVLVFWGACGIFQKLTTNHISAESAMIWLVVGYLLLQPFLYPGKVLFHYSTQNIIWGLLSGFLSTLGSCGLYAALRCGGRASIVIPISAMYPLVVVVLAPFLLHESITLVQGCGVACALIGVALVST